MNWPRARLWLIVSFLLLDLLLAYVLFSGTDLPYVTGGMNRPALQEELSRYGLSLEAALPAQPGPLALARLQRLEQPPWLLPTLFPANLPEPVSESLPDGGTALVYANEQVTVRLEPGGRISVYYVNAMPERTPQPASSDAPGVVAAARAAALDWLAAWDGLPDDATEVGVRVDPATGATSVMWRQAIGDMPLYGSYLQLTLLPASEAAGGVASSAAATGQGDKKGFLLGQWERLWFRPLGPTGEPRPPVPAATALLRLAGHLESTGAAGGTITAVTLGYYTRPYAAETWEVPPVWCLELADGRRFFVNALTGELETN